MLSGELTIGRAHDLARLATHERERFLPDALGPLLDLARGTHDDDAFRGALRFWAERVDEHVRPKTPAPHRLHLSQRLFGGGTIIGDLSPAAFATVAAALDAHLQDPDPIDAPHRRTLAERRADALDDMAHHSLTCRHRSDGDDDIADELDDDTADLDVLEDELDLELTGGSEGSLDLLRHRLRTTERQRRRRARRAVRPRSGVTTNVHIDLRTLAGRPPHELDGLVLRTDGWQLAEAAARRLLCDSALVATLFDGPNEVLDANAAAERFSPAQRRAIAARDEHCVFPSCRRAPRLCDAHHLEWRSRGGPTVAENGALLCRFHHRLVHEHGWDLEVDDRGHWCAIDRHGQTWTGRPSGLPPPDG